MRNQSEMSIAIGEGVRALKRAIIKGCDEVCGGQGGAMRREAVGAMTNLILIDRKYSAAS